MDKEERAWQVLRALGDVPDEYLLDAMDEWGGSRPAESGPATPAGLSPDAAASPSAAASRPAAPAEPSPVASPSTKPAKKRGVLLTYRTAMRWVAIAAACLLVVVVVRTLPGIGLRPVDGDLAAAPDDGVAAPETGEDVTVVNPIQEFDSLDELEDAAGFSIRIPAAEAPYDNVSYLLIDGEIAEVDYRDEAGVGYALRKAASQAGASADAGSGGSDSDGADVDSADYDDSDISGDSTEYAYRGTVQAALTDGSEIAVNVRGEAEDALRVATWTYGGYDYAIVADADAPALTDAAVLDIARSSLAS